MAIIRKTKSLKALLEIFEQASGALTVVELVEQVRILMNKTTVYRILEKLENEGVLHSFIGNEGLTWYAKCDDCTSVKHTDTHPHFQCNNCGKVECLSVHVSIPRVPNHRIDTANLLLTGQCEKCGMVAES